MTAARHIHLDPLGGIAGDMFLAALLDLRPDLAAGTFAAMRAAGLPAAWRTELVSSVDGALAGRRVRIERREGGEDAPEGDWRALERRLAGATLAPGIRQKALAILTLLAEAEAAVHAVTLDRVHFHELGDWDSIADVVGAACLIEAVQPCSWSCAPVPLGSGRVRTRHGPLPVPAPATARLLEGLPVLDDGIGGERVTPTGAAILRHLAPSPRLPEGAWRLSGSGFGLGTRRLDGVANVLRASLFKRDAAGRADERVAVITFEVDDQSPEDLALAVDALRASEGVLDVLQTAALGKKGRLATQVQVLVRPEHLDAAIDRCLVETTTIGLRWRVEARAMLARTEVEVEGRRVKVVRRPDRTRTAKADIGGVAGAPGHDRRSRHRRAAEEEALRRVADEQDG